MLLQSRSTERIISGYLAVCMTDFLGIAVVIKQCHIKNMIQNNAEESSANISRTASSVIRHQVNLLYMQAPISNTSAIIVTVLIYIILRTRIESNVLRA
jgi:hypothetical protein